MILLYNLVTMPEHKLLIIPKDSTRQRRPPNNLPVHSLSLIGRESDVNEILRILKPVGEQPPLAQEAHWLTLTGPGGVGKTSLALQTAEELLDSFQDGVFFVEMASITEPELVIPAIAGVLQLREVPDKPLISTLTEHLKDKATLLVIDNFEQLASARSVLAELVASCPQLSLIVTSRAPLRSQAEREYVVASLSFPTAISHLTAGQALKYGAIALFTQKARSIDSSFALTDENAAAVAEVCTRVDGLPLAIELVASHSRVLSPQAMLVRLTSPLRLLADRTREAPARHKTIRATIEWSYDLLTGKEQQLLNRLSTFVGGFSLRAAEAVCNEAGEITISPDRPEALDVLEGLERLIDSSLVRRVSQPDGTVAGEDRRFTMLQIVREFAQEQLEAAVETHALEQRFIDYFLWLGEHNFSEYHNQMHEIEFWLTLVKLEENNLRAALNRLLERESGDASAKALRLLKAYGLEWQRVVQPSEYMGWLNRALSHVDDNKKDLRIWALRKACSTAMQHADYLRAKETAEQALTLAGEVGDTWQITELTNMLGQIAFFQDDYATARILMERALADYRNLDKDFEIAATLMNLGQVAYSQGDYPYGETLLLESLSRIRGLGSPTGLLHATLNLGHIQRHLHKSTEARASLLEALELAQKVDAPRMAAEALTNISGLVLDQLANQVSPVLLNSALKQVARICGLASGLLEASGRRLEPLPERELEANTDVARTRLGEAAFTAAWEEGRAMDLSGALELAGKDTYSQPDNRPRGRGRPKARYVGGLTAREFDAVALVARGMTNVEIAEELILSVRTVEAHVASSLQKLGLHTRAELAAWAVREGILPDSQRK